MNVNLLKSSMQYFGQELCGTKKASTWTSIDNLQLVQRWALVYVKYVPKAMMKGEVSLIQ